MIGLLTCGSSSHVPVAHPPSSSILVIGAVFWPKVWHPLLVGDSVDCWPSRVGHLWDGSLWAIQSPRWKPGRTGHGRLLRTKKKERGKCFCHVTLFIKVSTLIWLQNAFFLHPERLYGHTILFFSPISDQWVCKIVFSAFSFLICMSTAVAVMWILHNR